MRTPTLLVLLALTACGGPEVGDTDPPPPRDVDQDGVAADLDCNDEDASVYPDAPELCDGVDNDCDGLVDDEDDVLDEPNTFYADADDDGYGDANAPTDACEAPEGYVVDDQDCDDSDADLNPDTVWYQDNDADGYGNPDYSTTACEEPSGYVRDGTDCDDTNAELSPGATEICDLRDNDCDDLADDRDDDVDDASKTTFYRDVDDDGYGVTDDTARFCNEQPGYASVDGDCDDADPSIYPGAEEICDDGVLNDCDGTAIECVFPDGYTADADYSFTGPSNQDRFGRLSGLGDINGDGTTDILATIEYDDTNGSNAGALAIYYGPISAGGTWASADALLLGMDGTDRLGNYADGLDMDGDGYDELVVGAYQADPGSADSGAVYLIAGSSTALEDADIDDVWDARWSDSTTSRVGSVVRNMGDLDDDGYEDLGFSADRAAANGSSSGAAFLVYGGATLPSGDLDLDDVDARFDGNSGTTLGAIGGLAPVGDIDADGYGDIGLGAVAANGNTGVAYLFYGSSDEFAGTYDAPTDCDAYFPGPSSNAYMTRAMDGGDLDGDGYDDFVVSAERAESNKGRIYVHLGGSSPPSGSTTAGSASITFTGDTGGDYFGTILRVEDVDLDGADDLIVGSNNIHDGSTADVGAVWLFLGSFPTGASYTADADHDAKVTGSTANAHVGARAINWGDVDGDGIDDLVVAAHGNSSLEGELFVFLGGGM